MIVQQSQLFTLVFAYGICFGLKWAAHSYTEGLTVGGDSDPMGLVGFREWFERIIVMGCDRWILELDGAVEFCNTLKLKLNAQNGTYVLTFNFHV